MGGIRKGETAIPPFSNPLISGRCQLFSLSPQLLPKMSITLIHTFALSDPPPHGVVSFLEPIVCIKG